MIQVKESGMTFEFNEDQIFVIEKSDLHSKIGNGIKTVEFIVCLRENELAFVEAKSSSPKPIKENKEIFENFISDITEKFEHSFNLYLSTILRRYNTHEIHTKFFSIDYKSVKFKFILIIKGHEIEWLQPLSDALYRSLLYHNRIWKSSIILLNEQMAKEYQLVKE